MSRAQTKAAGVPGGNVLLELDHVALSLPTASGSVLALSDVSFTVRRGETYALAGESGCGKSLTASAIMRLLPDGAKLVAGDIRFEGVSLAALTESEMRRWRGRRIAMIFQEPGTALNPVMTVGDQIAEAVEPGALPAGVSVKEDVLHWLERVGLPEPRQTARKYPHELSGGQKQRILIAMALAARPSLIIADEPTTALDVTLQAQVLELLKDLQKAYGLSILLITHDLAVVRSSADRLSLLYAGETIETARVEDFFRRPLHPYAQALFGALPGENRTEPLRPIEGSVPDLFNPPAGCRFAPRCPFAREACRRSAPALTALSDERLLRCPVAAAAPEGLRRKAPELPVSDAAREPAPARLAVSHLTVRYGSRLFAPPPAPVVRDVSFTLAAGETLALVGESGSGKTTTALAVLGLLGRGARAAGSVTLDNVTYDPGRARDLAALRRRIQVVFQDPFASLDPRMTIRESLTEGMRSLRPEWDAARREARLLELIEAVGLPQDALERLPHAFSGGQRQRVAIARALAPEPEIIICDEPTSALDVSVQAQILNLLRRLQREKNLAYIFITHNFAVVGYMADRIAVMQKGEIVETGDAKTVLSAPCHPYTGKLLESVPVLMPET